MKKCKRVCLNCNKEFFGYGLKYCSRSCGAYFNNKDKITPTFCKICNIQISDKWSPKKQCVKCKLLILNKKYGNKPITLGELRDKFKVYKTHAKIRGWARRNFRRNGGIMQCKICGYRIHCEVCHIKPVSSFDKNTTINTINDFSNLVCLCPNHHWEFDNGFIQLN